MEEKLLIRFLERKCEVEEARLVLQWIEQSEENKAAFVRLQSLWTAIEMDKATELNEACVRSIMHQVKAPRIRRNWYRSMATIASCAAAILLFVFIYPYFTHTPQQDYEALLRSKPNSKDVVLLHGSDNSIELESDSVKVSYLNTKSIVVNGNMKISKEPKAQPNMLYVPKGKRSVLTLADGSVVYLNSGSTIIYPSDFEGDVREVYFEGEGYFAVKKSAGKKFIVKTRIRSIEVLGTEFNVFVDNESEIFETVLVNGSISLNTKEKHLVLKPNECYRVNEKEQEEQLKTVDVRDYTSWKDNRLYFNKEKMEFVIKKLENVYDIKITVHNSKYLNYVISGNLNLKNSPEETLDIVMSLVIPDYKPYRKKYYSISVNQ